MQSFRKSVLFSATTLIIFITPTALAQEIQEILVTSDFRQSPEMQMPVSVSVVGSQHIADRAAQHLDQIVNVAPNVNFAAGASRGRYIQIRGIGERSQFVDPVNPSVGLTVDGVNLSGVGNAATLFDIEQVEVLRGPQGTRFGANALAGMVNITSKAPTDELEGQVTAGLGNVDSWRLGAVISGPLATNVQGRLAVEQYTSDGFIKNDYLGRDDTNDRNEATLRGRLRWQASDQHQIDAGVFFVDVNNGYDGFSLDNNRHTLSDQPGTDAQETLGLSINSRWSGSRAFDLVTTLAFENTDIEYGYDEDWTNTAICDGLACDSDLWGFDWWYASTDTYYRERQSVQLDTRLVSTENGKLLNSVSWVAGLYGIDQQEDLTRAFFDWDAYAPAEFDSKYDTRRIAAYGELLFPLSDVISLTLGGRVEDYSADYHDSRGVDVSPNETLWGGEIRLSYQPNDDVLIYGLVSRGFKAGGVNGEALGKAQQSQFSQSVISFLEDRLVFETETARNMEVGIKTRYLDDRGQLRLSLFHMKRNDVQLKGWYNEGPLFVGYIDNGAKGTNQGVEVEASFSLTERIGIFGSLGLLETEIEDFSILGDDDILIDKTGRDQAHAPGYQFNAGMELLLTQDIRLTVEADGKDKFYFSDSHDQQSEAYTLVHASVEYSNANLTVALWGRNLGDKEYAVRGFYFPNDPREFYGDDKAYIQLGDPRTYGVTATYQF